MGQTRHLGLCRCTPILRPQTRSFQEKKTSYREIHVSEDHQLYFFVLWMDYESKKLVVCLKGFPSFPQNSSN